MQLNKSDFPKINWKTSRPDPAMTDMEWQEYLNKISECVSPADEDKLTFNYTGRIFGSEYCGDSQYMYYKRFINSVLASIRKGEEDYCFYIYQIIELLRFEHDRLQCEWLPEDGVFKCSLLLL